MQNQENQKNQENQITSLSSSSTDISCQSTAGYFYQAESRELMAPDQVSMAIEIIGGEAFPFSGGRVAYDVKNRQHPLVGLAVGDPIDKWSFEYQGAYGGDPDELYYHNAATCPDCGQGMMQVSDQLACPGCGYASCGG